MNTQLDRVFEILSEPRRRGILRRIRDAEVERIEDLLTSNRDREALLATHVDLPKLADAGYIVWERESGTVSTGPRFDEVAAVLDLFDDHAEELPFGWPEESSTAPNL